MSATSKTILVIEHDHLSLRVLCGILQNNGFNVIPTSSPDQGLELLPIVDVVLCSYDMPYQMCDVLRNFRRRKPGVRFYMTSVTAFDELAIDVQHNITGYIRKPFRMERIEAFMTEVARQNAAQNDARDTMLGAA